MNAVCSVLALQPQWRSKRSNRRIRGLEVPRKVPAVFVRTPTCRELQQTSHEKPQEEENVTLTMTPFA